MKSKDLYKDLYIEFKDSNRVYWSVTVKKVSSKKTHWEWSYTLHNLDTSQDVLSGIIYGQFDVIPSVYDICCAINKDMTLVTLSLAQTILKQSELR